jgi:hypothetical protein
MPKFPSLRSNKAVLFSLLTVVIGFVATIFLISTFTTTDFTNNVKASFPEPADYHVEEEQSMGEEILENGRNQTHQTLNLLVSGARINSFNFENLDLGKTGQDLAFELFGSNNSEIYCETILIDGLVSPTLTIANASIHNLIIQDNIADGNSFSTTLGTTPDITFGSTRGSIEIPQVKDSNFDMIIIDTSTTDATCNALNLINLSAFGGGVSLSNFKVGTLTIINSRIGDGTGIDDPSFILEDIEASNMNISNNLEEPIYVN